MFKLLGSWMVIGLLALTAAGCGQEPTSAGPSVPERGIAWLEDPEQALGQAEEEAALVAVDFYAAWCGVCRMMEQQTFTDPRVRARLGDFVPLKVDVETHPELAGAYEVTGLPTNMVLDAEGKVIVRRVGFLDAAAYLAMLDEAAEEEGTRAAGR